MCFEKSCLCYLWILNLRNKENISNDIAIKVNSIPELFEVIHHQDWVFVSMYRGISTYTNHCLKTVIRRQHAVNIVEDMDDTDTIWIALKTLRAASTEASKPFIISSKSGYLHESSNIPVHGSFFFKDIVRAAMKCLFPILNVFLCRRSKL